jgi:hypothetical protein
MNPRRITLKYMSWCPGFKQISDHMPNREIYPSYRLLAASTAVGLLAIALFTTLFAPPLPTVVNGQLQIYLGEKRIAYNDGDFDQNFNYTLFELKDWGSDYPYFIQEKDESDFSDGAVSIIDYEFKTLDEVYNFTSQLNAPNCVDQYIFWLMAQNYTETVEKVYATPDKQAKFKNNGYLDTLIGDVKPYDRNYGIRYSVRRICQEGGFMGDDTGFPGTESEGNLNIIDGIRVEKFDSQDLRWRLIVEGGWVFNSERYPSIEPIYKVRLVRFPAGNGFVVKGSLGH